MPLTVLKNSFFSGNEGLGKFEPLTTLNHRRIREEIKIDKFYSKELAKTQKFYGSKYETYTSPVHTLIN